MGICFVSFSSSFYLRVGHNMEFYIKSLGFMGDDMFQYDLSHSFPSLLPKQTPLSAFPSSPFSLSLPLILKRSFSLPDLTAPKQPNPRNNAASPQNSPGKPRSMTHRRLYPRSPYSIRASIWRTEKGSGTKDRREGRQERD